MNHYVTNRRSGRIQILQRVLLACLVLLVVRLMYMQLFRYEDYTEQANGNMIRSVPVPAPRGVVFDCRGRVLARNEARFTIKLSPLEGQDSLPVLNRIATVIRLPEKQYRSLVQQLRESPQEPLVIKEPLDDVALARFAEMQSSVPGLYLDMKPVRVYPLGEVASHVLGHVGEIDENKLDQWRERGYVQGEWVGKDGVEYARERALHGKSGTRDMMVNVSGVVERELSVKPGRPGKDLYLAIDARLQSRAEEALEDTLRELRYSNGESSGGAVVAVEAKTGYVRAMVSLPDYNPNWFSSGISARRFKRLLHDQRAPLLNKAVCGACPPGSTFKLVTTAAALEEGLISPYSTFYCPGVYYVSGLPFNCFVRSGHGPLDLTECIAQSCDVAYYQMGVQLGLPRLYKYARAFGMGQKTGIDLPGETAGIFPAPGWKEKELGEKWFPGDNANTAIGQGFVAASPIQLAMMTAAVANGGTIYRPQLVERIAVASGSNSADSYSVQPVAVRQVPVHPQYLAAVRRGMAGTVSHGTAASRSGGIDMAGKTGTAENSATPDNPYGRNHAWFTGFAPVDDPELVVTVFLEKSGGYGGALAAPIAFSVVREWKKIQASRLVEQVVPVVDREE